MDIIAPQTKELWEKSCCIEQSWYRTAEEMKRHASSLEEENRKLRELFPKILDALDNGSGCTPEVSLEFLQGIPKEIELVVKRLKHESSYAEDERIDIAKQLESEKKIHAETQNKLDEISHKVKTEATLPLKSDIAHTLCDYGTTKLLYTYPSDSNVQLNNFPVSMRFRSKTEVIEQLCLKVFGATPVYRTDIEDSIDCPECDALASHGVNDGPCEAHK